MKHEILKDFLGSQDGTMTELFTAGTVAELSDYLAHGVVAAGWAQPFENKAIVTDGSNNKKLQIKAK